ncbi:hypothetical protein KKA27_01515, partial [Patescibacteria group bacterium]|nr:hypothetical protein [Patescibacteria group bacterium]
YNTASKVIKMYDGSDWFTVGTTTSGLTLSGHRLQLADLNHYLTLGTTTQSGLSMLTLEATSTAAIPLTLRGYASQTANLFQVHDVAGTELFALDFAGNASTTMISTTGNIWVDGILTVAGNSVQASADIGGGYNTLGTGSGITLSTAGKIQLNSDLEVNGYATTTASNGNFNTNGSIAIASTTPAQELTVTGDAYFGSAATTTLHIKSTAASTGGCVEIEGANDTIYRFYATTTGPIILEAGVCQ